MHARHRSLLFSVVSLTAACGGPAVNGAPERCEAMVDGLCYATRAEACAAASCPIDRCSLLRTEPAKVACDPPPAPPPEPVVTRAPEGNAAGCAADAMHCCQPDGTVVRPGGCQPSYPQDAVPGLLRGDDGRCVPDETECHVRCLPGDARIATPDGPVPVSTLAAGDIVFTEGSRGQRVRAPVLRTRAVPVTAPHVLTAITLGDGRRVRASPRHPDADGRDLATLTVGASLDGSSVTAVETIAHTGASTFDILPAGPTGAYWADGVRLGSTLSEANE